MNSIERKERFTELMATIELLPSIDDDSYDPKFPKGTLGLSDGNLKTAIMAQAMRGDEDFVGNLINALANTGFESAHAKHEADQEPDEDDLSAITLAIHVAWASGALAPMLMLLGGMGKMLSVFDLDTPEDLIMIFRPNGKMKDKAQQFDPIALLDMTKTDLIKYMAKELGDDD
jgi:hypothetical protein